MLDETGCDAVMIARGALGNPWIFKELHNHLLNNNNKLNISLKERANVCKRHYELLKKDKSEHVCLNLTKKHFSWYLKGFDGAAEWRKKFMYSKSNKEIEELLKAFI